MIAIKTTSELDRKPIAFDDNYVHDVLIERVYYIERMSYYTSKTGRSVAVQLFCAKQGDQITPAPASPRYYIDRNIIEPGADEQMLFNLATWKLTPWRQRAQAKFWHQSLVEQCRPFRATHKAVLSAVAKHMHGRFGPTWWEQDEARKLAVATLIQFGVAVNPST